MTKTLLEKQDERLYNTPEKWFIRKKWVDYAKNRKQKNAKEFLKILTFTSVNCYEIEFFKENGLISMNGSIFNPESLAVCEYNNQRYALIRDKLPNAKCILLKFEELIGAGIFGIHKLANNLFPFDIINLDFTKPITDQRQDMLDAIIKTIRIQKTHRQSFSLFLTIQASQDSCHMLQEILNNNQRYSFFKEKFESMFPRGLNSNSEEYLLLTIPKLILNTGLLSENFDIKCQEKYIYKSRSGRSKMVSFIFDCDYIDDIVEGQNPATYLGGIYSSRVLEMMDKEIENITNRLRDNSEMMSSMKDLCRKFAS